MAREERVRLDGDEKRKLERVADHRHGDVADELPLGAVVGQLCDDYLEGIDDGE